MAENENQAPETGEEPDYKAMFEKAQAEADKWKALSKKNETRAKDNAEAAKSLEEANQRMTDLSERLSAIEGENATLKADAERSALVAKVAAETGVPEPIVGSFAANDEESLKQAATAILEAYSTRGGAPAALEAGSHVATSGTAKSNKEKFGEAIAQALGA